MLYYIGTTKEVSMLEGHLPRQLIGEICRGVVVLDAEYEPLRKELRQAGLNEEQLRQMDPDDRVALLEQAELDPYDYIYLAC